MKFINITQPLQLICVFGFVLFFILLPSIATAADKPNILVIWGDDIGRSNISAYTMGMMGYETPMPLIFNLRRDPYERAQITSNT